MNVAKRIFVALGLALISICLMSGVVLASFTLALGKPDNLKRWLRESDIYNQVVPGLIEQVNKSAERQPEGAPAEENAFKNPEIQTAVKQSVTPTFLQKSAEDIIDGTYAWLQGTTPKPSYHIDLVPVKATFAQNIGAAARSRLASLPPCTPANPPVGSDPFKINCRPPQQVTDPEIQKLIDQITTSKEFLPTDKLTADTAGLGAQSQPQAQPAVPWYEQAKQLPKFYQVAMIAPLILGGLAALLAVGVVFASPTRRKGLHVVAAALLGAGITIGCSALVSLWLFGQLGDRLGANPQNAFQVPLLSVVKSAGPAIVMTQLWGAVGMVVAGGGGIVALWLLRTKSTPQPPAEHEAASGAGTNLPTPDKPPQDTPDKPDSTTPAL